MSLQTVAYDDKLDGTESKFSKKCNTKVEAFSQLANGLKRAVSLCFPVFHTMDMPSNFVESV
jgi:hypothetical protein